MIVAGIGCKKGANSEAIATAIRAAQKAVGITAAPDQIATLDDKRAEQGILQAAEQLAIPIVFLSRDQLSQFADAALTSSIKVKAVKGVPSVAETAALAAAGQGGKLLGPRVAVGDATCAIATGAAP